MTKALLLDLSGVLYDGDNLIPACLVRTGKYTVGDEHKIDGDFHVVDSIVDVAALVQG